MALFDQILGAINNPAQQGHPDQLSSILDTVQQFAGDQGMNPSASQAVMTLVGNHVRSALQQRQSQGGRAEAETIVNQYSGTHPNFDAVQSLFSPQQQQQISQEVGQRTGLSAEMIQSLLPVLVPVILNLLRTGATQNPGQGTNSVLSAFLDSDRDGDFDVGDALSMAGRFLNQR